jgi:hypothetical protein
MMKSTTEVMVMNSLCSALYAVVAHRVGVDNVHDGSGQAAVVEVVVALVDDRLLEDAVLSMASFMERNSTNDGLLISVGRLGLFKATM